MEMSNKPFKKNNKFKTVNKVKIGSKLNRAVTIKEINKRTSVRQTNDLNNSQLSSQGGNYSSPDHSVRNFLKSISKNTGDNDLEKMIDNTKTNALRAKIKFEQMGSQGQNSPITFSRTLSPNKLMEDIQELRSLNLQELQYGDENNECEINTSPIDEKNEFYSGFESLQNFNGSFGKQNNKKIVEELISDGEDFEDIRIDEGEA